jgi:hypothetical protein
VCVLLVQKESLGHGLVVSSIDAIIQSQTDDPANRQRHPDPLEHS